MSFFLTVNYGQPLLHGTVVDKETKMPLAFANLTIQNTTGQIICDLNGNFSFTGDLVSRTVVCSHVGYEKKECLLDIKKGNYFLIELEISYNNLGEIILNDEDLLANEIIQKVIANKELNDPENLNSFIYKSYNKIVYDYKLSKNDTTYSIDLRKRPKGNHFFMMESITERKFVKPNLSQEIIIGTKVSGFQNPSFASIATDFQPFSFYGDNIKFFNINYLNPISKGSISKYRFNIKETLVDNADTIYIISFKPRKHKNFDGLKGLLYVNSKKYALQNVIASPAEKGKVDVTIQQKYSLVDNEFWFPEQLNFIILFNEFPTKENPMVIDGKTYLSDIWLNFPIDKKEFSNLTVRLEDEAASKDSIFWDTYRKEKLSTTERNTYGRMDSIGRKNNFDTKLKIVEKLVQRRYPLNYLDIDLSKTLLYNKYEGLRIGTGFFTNENISKNIIAGAFLGYGTKDEGFKYGGEVLFKLSKKDESIIGIHYKNDLAEAGRYDGLLQDNGLLDFRKMIGYRFDQVNQASITFHFRSYDFFLWDFSFQRTRTTPKYDYLFINQGQNSASYTNSSFKVGLKFAFKEQFITAFSQNISTGTNYPIVYLKYSKGMKNVLESDFNYNKIELALEQSLYARNLGTTTYRGEVGYIDKPLPYGLLFTGEGSYDMEILFIMKNTFQTLLPYEFLSNKYLNVFMSHNFGGLLFKKDKFQPDIILHQNLGWGTLTDKAAQNLIGFKTKHKTFLESGLQFNNLIKLNYYNLANVGLGAATFYRYGYYKNPEFKDNIAFKITLSVSIK